MKSHIVIIGAGLGGCFLANGLIREFDVTMVDLPDQGPLLRDLVNDVAWPAVTYPNIDSGFGGTTKAWHNALMEIEDSIFISKWPFKKDELLPYYELSYIDLAGITRGKVLEYAEILQNKLFAMGFSKSLLSQNMFIPRVRINAWNFLGLSRHVKKIEGEVEELVDGNEDSIVKIRVRKNGGDIEDISADYFVLAAGGLGTPLLLQKLSTTNRALALKHAGMHYEDHPTAYVGEVELGQPLYKLWNLPVKTKNGGANIRIPFSFDFEGLKVSFQLRPSHHLRLSKPREKIFSVLSDLRNFPCRLENYWRLIMQLDDLLEILSFKYGLRFPTCKYSILMVAEQPPASHCAVWRSSDDRKINRSWNMDEAYINHLKEAISLFIKTIDPMVNKVTIYENWTNAIFSSSHHSGTARISNSPNDGVCDINGKVHNINNLYICDGSIIPASGFVNTGLTIVAMAKRMSDYLIGIASPHSASK